MSTSDLAEARVEALRSRDYRRGIFFGGTAVALFAMLCAVAYHLAFANRMAQQSDGSASGQRSLAGARDNTANDGQSVDDEEKQDADPSDERSQSRGAASDGVATSVDDRIRQLDEQFTAFRADVNAKLTDLATDESDTAARGDDASEESSPANDWRKALMERLDALDKKVTGFDRVAESFAAFYDSELPDLRRTVDSFPKTEFRQSSDEVNGSTNAAATNEVKGTLVLNNSTGVEGYVEVNGELVWLDLGENEIETTLGEIVVKIPNGGRTYRLDAGLWKTDGDGRYVMNRPSWPPTAP